MMPPGSLINRNLSPVMMPVRLNVPTPPSVIVPFHTPVASVLVIGTVGVGVASRIGVLSPPLEHPWISIKATKIKYFFSSFFMYLFQL